MKSVITSNPVNETEIKFPCLMIHKNSGNVVLFYDEYCGMQVFNVNGKPIGFHSDNFIISQFIPFTGTIELSND